MERIVSEETSRAGGLDLGVVLRAEGGCDRREWAEEDRAGVQERWKGAGGEDMRGGREWEKGGGESEGRFTSTFAYKTRKDASS